MQSSVVLRVEDIALLKRLANKRLTCLTYFHRFLTAGVDAHNAVVASYALVRLKYENIPPSTVQRQSLQVCWDTLMKINFMVRSSA